MAGTEHGEHLGVLRLDFDSTSHSLRHVSWANWMATFDAQGLIFLYLENRSDGLRSNFFRIENPPREDL